MKTLITTITFLIAFTSFSQIKELQNADETLATTIQSVEVSITIDSVKELESTFNLNDIKSIVDDMSPDENISFEIKCNGKPMSNGKEASATYKITGKAGEKEAFYNNINTIKKLVTDYYNNQ